MTEPYVRPDVRPFLDYLNACPGPKPTRSGRTRRATMMLAVAPRRRRAGRRAGGDPRSCLPGAGRRDPAAALRCARDARGGPAVALLPRRRLRVRRPRHPRAVLRRDRARSSICRWWRSTTGSRPSIPGRPGPRIASPRRAGRPASPEALGREVTGLVTAGDSAGGNFTIVVSLALRDEPAAVPVLAQWPIYPAADPGQGLSVLDGFRRGLSADPRRHATGSTNATGPTRRTGAIRRW